MKEWAGLVFLLGAAAGYGAFMGFQPYRRILGESYRALRDYPCLWLAVGIFESVRITVAAIAPVWRGEAVPEAFLETGRLGRIPYVSDLFLSALEGAAGGLLSLATVFVNAWPVSLGIAIFLFLKGGGILGRLRGEEGEAGGFVRRGYAFLGAGMGVIHLVGALWLWMSGGEAPANRAVEVVLGSGGRLFEVTCAVAVQVWVILWLIGKGRKGFEGVSVAAVTGRTGRLFPLILCYWGVAEGWRMVSPVEGIPGRLAVPVAAVAGLFLLPAVIRTIGGEAGILRSILGRGFWVVAHFEMAFWWALAAGIHLFLLFLCGLGMEEALGGMPWALWGWGLFYAFLKAGVIVWLLGAFVMLVEESLNPIRVPKKRRKRKRK